MFFDSVSFGIFLVIVFTLYWFVVNKNLQHQNLLLLSASYFFYACWNFGFLFVLMLSTLIDYLSGIQIEKSTTRSKQKAWLILSVLVNLSFLCAFKYYNFFISSFSEWMHHLHLDVNPTLINIGLPVGISFYTFHGLSYVFDVYHKRITAEKNIISYSVFVSFFPLLVAGPIERATHLLPQIQNGRNFDYAKAVDGLRQILWGLFKKLVISNQCGVYVQLIFSNPAAHNGSTLLIGALLFAIQIYADFSGYTDIALGTARLFGIELLQNFSFPFFSRSLTEFWRRWHISLSGWFRDYLYIPLCGNKRGKLITIRNTFIIFLIGGFWHGASWTFIVWGFVNALYLIPSVLFPDKNASYEISAKGKLRPSIKEISGMLRTFLLISLVCIFFRSENLTKSFEYFNGLFSSDLFSAPDVRPFILSVIITFFFIIEWMGRENTHALYSIGAKWPKVIRLGFYYVLITAVFLSRAPEQQFIYFQF